MLRQNDDFLFYSTSVYKTNAFVVYINTMALSNKLHVHKQGHYEYRRVQYNLYCLYIVHVKLIWSFDKIDFSLV